MGAVGYASGDPGKVDEALLTAKGDLYVATAPGVVTRLPVGTNGQVLTARSSVTSGVRWETPSGGGSGGGFRGEWDSGINYAAGDIVRMDDFAASFGALEASTNAPPAVEWAFLTTAPTDQQGDGGAYTMGFRFAVVGGPIRVRAVEYYKDTANGGTHVGRLWNDDTDALIEAATFTGETSTGLQSAAVTRVLPVGNYLATVDMPNGNYLRATGFFTAAVTRGRVVAPINAGGFASATNSIPTVFGSTSYGVSLRWEEYDEANWSIVGRY